MPADAVRQSLFIDIETVSAEKNFEALSPEWQALWALKAARVMPSTDTPSSFYPKHAAIMAEFGKIICVSIGYFHPQTPELQLRIKSFFGAIEADLLANLVTALEQLNRQLKGFRCCGHNIREFDIPYLCRRLLACGMAIPSCLDFQAMKPWEVNVVDTLQMWKFGDHKHYISLRLLAAVLGIDSPKDDIDGSMVGSVYWQQQDLPRIVAYCQKDVVTVAQAVLKLRQMPLLTPDQVVFVH
jgi:3'-5' exonuclease